MYVVQSYNLIKNECFFFVGMNINEDVKTQRSDHQLPSASSEASYDSCSLHRSDTSDVEKVSAFTNENKWHIKKVGGETRTN